MSWWDRGIGGPLFVMMIKMEVPSLAMTPTWISTSCCLSNDMNVVLISITIITWAYHINYHFTHTGLPTFAVVVTHVDDTTNYYQGTINYTTHPYCGSVNNYTHLRDPCHGYLPGVVTSSPPIMYQPVPELVLATVLSWGLPWTRATPNNTHKLYIIMIYDL